MLLASNHFFGCNVLHSIPRKGFPTTHGGKAHDTGLLMSWLEEEVDEPKAIAPVTNAKVCIR